MKIGHLQLHVRDADVARVACPYREPVQMVTHKKHFLSASGLRWSKRRGSCNWLDWRPAAAAVRRSKRATA